MVRHDSLNLVVKSLFLLLLLSLPSKQQKISQSDFAALRAIKNSLTDSHSTIPNTSFFSSWNFATSNDPCSFFAGISCSSPLSTVNPFKRVTSLTLGTGLIDSPGLAGSLSPSISNLTELTQLILYAGIVTGPIPPDFGLLRNLRVLSLTNNRLIGPIPAIILNLHKLHTLDLSGNLLSGTIPTGIAAGLDQLKVLVLASNKLFGQVPDLPAQLLHLDLKNNRFSGTLPERIPLSLRYLSVTGNQMWGPINGLESLSDLVYLDLSMNQFSGTLPPSLFRATLPSMLLQRNNFSGGVHPSTISSTLFDPESIVDLSHNSLTGELPPTLAGVKTLFLNNNHFNGTVPNEYAENVYNGNTKTLYLQHNYITRFPELPPGGGRGGSWGLSLPDSALVCVSYNCMVPPAGLQQACPVSAGEQLSRPAYQCSVFNNGSSNIG